jgi:hypothetical protein
MIPITSRRALLQGAAVLSAVPVAATVDVSPGEVAGEPEPCASETNIQRRFREWEALQDEASAAADANPDQADEEWSAREPERRRIEAAIAAERPTNMRDLAIQVLVNSGEGTSPLDSWLALECAALAGRDLAKLPHCLFKGDVRA